MRGMVLALGEHLRTPFRVEAARGEHGAVGVPCDAAGCGHHVDVGVQGRGGAMGVFVQGAQRE